ncbi:MAG: glutamine-hydrolyzing carbamoyl-phosphate synthase small subunit, partial [Elusimicrobiota bacterium]
MAKNIQTCFIALEDGTFFEDRSFGASGEKTGEIVFNTSMTGYQEILTDPSYKGQMVTMTYPLIGNYGINKEDFESAKPWVEGFIVKEYSKIVSNWRSRQSLGDFLKQHGIVAIESVDTRALTKHLRNQGAMRACISTEKRTAKQLIQKAKDSPGLENIDLVKEVTCRKPYQWNKSGKHKVIVIDCGVKYNILNELSKNDCQVTVVPAKTSAKQILEQKPDGLMLSNGPGDPSAVTYVVQTVKELIGKLPIFGICLG